MHERFWALLHPYGHQTALKSETMATIVITWQQTTADGLQFLAGGGRDEPARTLPMPVAAKTEQEALVIGIKWWKNVPKGTRVIVQRKGETLAGEFRFVSGNAIQVLLDGEKKPLACSPKTTVLEGDTNASNKPEGNLAVG
jgi:hypothetical protein